MTKRHRSRVYPFVPCSETGLAFVLPSLAITPGVGSERSRPRLEAAADEHLRDLVAAAAAGDDDAIATLYDRTGRRLYALALWRTGDEADAEEVVQEVFVRVVEQRVRLGGVRDPMTWLLAVTHRAAVDRIRRRAVRRAESIEQLAPLFEQPREAERAVDAARAQALLAVLPPTQRVVIYLRHFEERSLREIADIVRAPLFTVASRYRLGLARLRRALGRRP